MANNSETVVFFRSCEGTPCSNGKIIYAWAKNAKKLVLPKRKHILIFLEAHFLLNFKTFLIKENYG